MTLAEIFFEIELSVHDITTLLFWIQELIKSGLASSGFFIDPSMNESLFFTERAIHIARLQEAYFSLVSD